MTDKTITVVTGFTRCGTTLMMRMLHAGGIQPYAETLYGYETNEAIGLPANHKWIEKVHGMAVKILEPLHHIPPRGFDYRFILMVRNPKEQAKSQIKFIRAAGQPVNDSRDVRRRLQASLENDLPKMIRLLQGYHCPLLIVRFEDLIKQPLAQAMRVSEFCKGLNYESMAQQVQERQPDCLPYLMELSMIAGIRS